MRMLVGCTSPILLWYFSNFDPALTIVYSKYHSSVSRKKRWIFLLFSISDWKT